MFLSPLSPERGQRLESFLAAGLTEAARYHDGTATPAGTVGTTMAQGRLRFEG